MVRKRKEPSKLAGKIAVRGMERRKRFQQAAKLVYEGVPNAEVAKRVDVAARTLQQWQKEPAFRGYLARLTNQVERAQVKALIATKAARLEVLQDITQRLLEIVKQRSEHEEFIGVPGGDTGLLCVDYKKIGQSIRSIFKVDAGLVSEIRAYLRQAAEETGQLSEATAEGKGTVNVAEAMLIYRQVITRTQETHGDDPQALNPPAK